MKYLKVFSKDVDYQAFVDGEDYVTPNISFVEENNSLTIKPYQKTLISFVVIALTYGNIAFEYQAENGMTWEEWINSEYNTNFSIDNNGGVFGGVGKGTVLDVSKTDLIKDNYTYYAEVLRPDC